MESIVNGVASVSVIMPISRWGADPERAINAVLQQRFEGLFELILVGHPEPAVHADPRVRFVAEADLNPALRRNRAAAVATAPLLAFIDDDAFAEPDWLDTAVTFFNSNGDVVAIGGPDPAPVDSPLAERISELLLSTPLIGSGIACHEGRETTFDLTAPHDIALVNLVVRTEIFHQFRGFDVAIGYIGEDTELVSRLLNAGRVVYLPSLLVRHRRRRFPLGYLRQRWRYRVKTGRYLVDGRKSYVSNPKIWAFLAAGFVFIATLFVSLPAAAILWLLYCATTLVLSWRRNDLPIPLWPFIPLFFLLHHATYFVGILAGAIAGALERGVTPSASSGEG